METLIVAILTFIIGILTFIGVVFTAVYTVKSKDKKTFTDVITTARKEHIQKFRDLIAYFLHVATIVPKDTAKLNQLKYKIRMHLNPAKEEYSAWDGRIIKLLDEIIANTQADTLKELEARSQSNIQLEWESMSLEANKGELTPEEKAALQEKAEIELTGYLRKIEINSGKM